ncbi:DUF2207 domain-containing protein [Candidatus Microgenomates bacterium]|nr:DUF2207 domain-containing protein [Candidatus Microgenomates bacterium]
MKRLWLIVIVAAMLWLPAPTRAASESIRSFDSEIKINQQGAATITETIRYDFGSNVRHGIERFVPIRQPAAQKGKYYFYDFIFLSVQMDGKPTPVDLQRDQHWQIMRIGDPEQTITGVHTYRLAYQLSPVIQSDSQGGYLNWNITGNDWNVPINKASTVITMATAPSISDARCYTGSYGSTQRDCTLQTQENRVPASAKTPLPAGQGLTVNVLVPSDLFDTYLVAQSPPPSEWLPWLGVALGLLAITIGLLTRLANWVRHKRELASQLVIAQYESPDELKPGEIGQLIDGRADMTEISATLIDLAVRGYLRIEQTQSKRLWRPTRYTFHRLQDYSNLPAFERQLMDLLFDDGKTHQKSLQAISASVAQPVISQVKSHFQTALRNKGYYAKNSPGSTRRKLLARSLMLIAILVIVANFYAYAASDGTRMWLVVFSTMSVIVGFIMAWGIAQRTELTPLGYKQWAQVEGFKLFLSVTETERLKFHDAPAKNPQLFSALLPYAVALGVEKAWAKQFKDMDISQATTWYSGSRPFNTVYIASSLGSDFGRSLASSFTPARSSGGSSSGGFSGGGGGGGGGGSW